MELARKLKQKSLHEYLLFMYQVEDIIRACKFEQAYIAQVVVDRFGSVAEDTEADLAWFLAMSELMKEEKVEQRGHLQHVVNLVNDLYQLHLRLTRATEELEYQKLYHGCASLEADLRLRGGQEENIVSLFLTAIYGVWLLGLKKVVVSNETRQAVEQMSSMLALLSKYYNQIEAGEKELPE